MRGSLLALIFVAAAAAQGPEPAQLMTPGVFRVGDKLACKCGVCNNTVGTCMMLRCGYTYPARAKIAEMQKQGLTDEVIVASFVKERGLEALATPPTQGFHLMSYLMPFIAILLGIVAIMVYWMRFRKPAAVPELPPIDNRMRERIEREMADFD